MERRYSVYIHTTPSGKVYVGMTGRDPLVRWRNGTGYSGSKYFDHAIKKYGWENIKHEVVLTNLTKQEACNAEKELIKKYDSTNMEKGYNRTFGGEEGLVFTPETKKKISEKSRQHHASLEYRRAASEWMRKRVVSEETRQKISEAQKGRKPVILPRETIERLAKEKKERYSSKKWKEDHKEQLTKLASYGTRKAKKVVQYTLAGEYVMEYKSMKEAGRCTGIRDGNICKCCKGMVKTAGGYIWQYAG